MLWRTKHSGYGKTGHADHGEPDRLTIEELVDERGQVYTATVQLLTVGRLAVSEVMNTIIDRPASSATPV